LNFTSAIFFCDGVHAAAVSGEGVCCGVEPQLPRTVPLPLHCYISWTRYRCCTSVWVVASHRKLGSTRDLGQPLVCSAAQARHCTLPPSWPGRDDEDYGV
jgi:hypothetical protein